MSLIKIELGRLDGVETIFETDVHDAVFFSAIVFLISY